MDFPAPKPHLEQYSTPPNVAVRMLNLAHGDIEGRVVFDLGCGTGILSVGAGLLGARLVVGVDVDVETLRVARANLKFSEGVFGNLPVHFVNADVSQLYFRADTVVMNPPFGMRKRGADRVFLEAALRGAGVVWTLLGAESDPFVDRLATEKGFAWERVMDFVFSLRKTMYFHKRERRSVRVSLYRLIRFHP